MSTYPQFSEEELTFILLTVLKTRNLLFECREVKFDKHSLPKSSKINPIWNGNRGTIPMLKDLNNLLALVRLHINTEETINMYDAVGALNKN